VTPNYSDTAAPTLTLTINDNTSNQQLFASLPPDKEVAAGSPDGGVTIDSGGMDNYNVQFVISASDPGGVYTLSIDSRFVSPALCGGAKTYIVGSKVMDYEHTTPGADGTVPNPFVDAFNASAANELVATACSVGFDLPGVYVIKATATNYGIGKASAIWYVNVGSAAAVQK
jgi:hypothetical protein